MGEAAALDGRWIPILWASVLFHDVLGGTNGMYAEVRGWESLSGSLSVSSMVQDRGIWRLGVLVGRYAIIVALGVVFSLGCCWVW